MTLAWAENPGRVEAHYPTGDCACGAGLDGAEVVGVARSHQSHDVLPIMAVVVQHDLYRVRCGCGRCHVADRPAGLAAGAGVLRGEPARVGALPAGTPAPPGRAAGPRWRPRPAGPGSPGSPAGRRAACPRSPARTRCPPHPGRCQPEPAARATDTQTSSNNNRGQINKDQESSPTRMCGRRGLAARRRLAL